jgi:hypothetical protein
LKLGKTKEFNMYSQNRPAIGICPPEEMLSIMEEGVMKIAPKGLDRCYNL